MTRISRGVFLTFEGVDGAGKSTHVQWAVEQLKARGLNVVSTREPGGTPIGEKLRELLLKEAMGLECETLLMFAARAQHIQKVIRPALEAGHWVVCDRFTDATFAYQGGGRQLGVARIAELEKWVHPDLQPDCTWLFDVPLEVARERLDRTRDKDRFEQEANAFFLRTREVYLSRAAQYPERFTVIDSTAPIEEVRLQLTQTLNTMIARSQQT
ncbi:dTMP kinase [Zwartia panacis]|uniref:dTMP kinase n=1 Tax=Zwartia panacis TaxID=2683345 RepID=UPI0025B31A1B|nr:dTMP kinase [Zwartia panacis]MDN4016793.1 dTMP kinase [Zwartia panacis]